MNVPDSAVACGIAAAIALAIAGAGFAALARIGEAWREITEEWWPDEVGEPDE